MHLNDLLKFKDNNNRLLGIDYGDKRMGLSISDTTWFIASPYKNFNFKNFSSFLEELNEIQKKLSVVAYVFGLPINMDGSKGEQTKKVEQFANKVHENTKIPIFFWDERWSTQAVEKIMISADISRKKRSKNKDTLAASYILQGVLDYLKFCY